VPATTDLDGLGLDEGGHLLLDHALGSLEVGDRLTVCGRHPMLGMHLAVWCRANGHRFQSPDGTGFSVVVKGSAEGDRWRHAVRAGQARQPPEAHADPKWGLAARGSLVEAGGPALNADLVDRDWLWADLAPRLYASAAASQWDPATAADWDAGSTSDAAEALPLEIEASVVQLMTYLIENEQAALLVPAGLLARIHPHFREVMQLLAIQAADEARHVEVFTRRALLHEDTLGVSGAGGRASLQTLLDEPDFTLATFLLSVLGEGTFLDLLRFLNTHAPDPVTASITKLVLQDESRHVAFGVAHTAHGVTTDPALLGRLRGAVERRHSALLDTAGLSNRVHDALVVLAAGSWDPEALRRGWHAVQQLQKDMDEGRQRRLAHIGFPADEAAAISALHTRNFM
jgi:hypothetical protein